MPTVLLVLAVCLLGFVIVRSKQQPDHKARECLNELLTALRSNPDLKAAEMAKILRHYGYDKRTASQVTRLVKPRLRQAGIRTDEQATVLHELSRTRHLL